MRLVSRHWTGVIVAAVVLGAGTLVSHYEEPEVSGQEIGSDAEIVKAITTLLTTQKKAWNRGSIDDFMKHYWPTDDLTFSSGGKTVRGWAATKARYKRRYTTREQMGSLNFDELEIQKLGESAALVLGRWQLDRKSGPIGGNFSLVLRRIDGRWLIIHDHTSVLETPDASPKPPTETPDDRN